MLARKIKILLPAVAGLTLTTWLAMGQQARRVDDAALKNAGKTGDEWLTYGVTPQETRYSPANQINADNVSRLGLAWSYDLGQGGGDQEATPLVWNGTLYGITNWSIVFAVDARTGKEKWRWDPEVNQETVRPKICCGIVNRGIALYQGMVIAPIIDGRLDRARTRKPGKLGVGIARCLSAGRLHAHHGAAHRQGQSDHRRERRRSIRCADSSTPTTPRPASAPGASTPFRAIPRSRFENAAMKKAAATWAGDYWKLGGGGSVWDGMAYDPEADLIYVGTGNGGPWPEELRKSKGKDNLYVASILAVKPDTGELKWYFQTVPGDSWDFDSVQQLLLADVTIKGQPRKVLMQANKNGFYYVIDRVTGQFISGQPFAKVTWAQGSE